MTDALQVRGLDERIRAAVVSCLCNLSEVQRVVERGSKIEAYLRDARGGVCTVDIDYDWPNGMPWEAP